MSEQVDVQIDEKIKSVSHEPPKYNVIFLNDDVTPMDWVIKVLKDIFKHSTETAEFITLTVHNEGSAVAGTYSYEIAEQKTIDCINSSKMQGFPLKVTMEKN